MSYACMRGREKERVQDNARDLWERERTCAYVYECVLCVCVYVEKKERAREKERGRACICDVYIVLRKKERELFQGTPCYYLPPIIPNNNSMFKMQHQKKNEKKMKLQISWNKIFCAETWRRIIIPDVFSAEERWKTHTHTRIHRVARVYYRSVEHHALALAAKFELCHLIGKHEKNAKKK